MKFFRFSDFQVLFGLFCTTQDTIFFILVVDTLIFACRDSRLYLGLFILQNLHISKKSSTFAAKRLANMSNIKPHIRIFYEKCKG